MKTIPLFCVSDKQLYIGFTETLHFHICDKNNDHIYGYWLFSILNGIYQGDHDIASDNRWISIDTIDLDNKRKLKVVGVDEI